MKLQGKSVVVTGASSGMGLAIVQRFVKEGASVVAVARRRERLEELAASLAGLPGKVLPFPGDVSRQEDIEAAIDAAVKEFGGLDILVNNAGIMDDMGPIGDFSNEKLEQVAKTNSDKADKAKKDKQSKPGIFARASKWLHELKVELKKVQWPTKKQTVNNTVIVIACVILVGLFIWVFDFIAGGAIKGLISLLG